MSGIITVFLLILVALALLILVALALFISGRRQEFADGVRNIVAGARRIPARHIALIFARLYRICYLGLFLKIRSRSGRYSNRQPLTHCQWGSPAAS
jgi:hypothetical protein